MRRPVPWHDVPLTKNKSLAWRGLVIDALVACAATALLLRLGGIWRPWLPSTGALLVALAVTCVLGSVLRDPSGTVRRWQAALSVHWFAAGLAAVSIAGFAYRTVDIGFDLGHAPVDIDEARLANSVLHLFRTGSIEHTTVEHYPGVHFWLLAGVYLLTYLESLTSGTASTFDAVPFETFVLAGRVCSSVVGVGTIVLVGFVGRRFFDARTGLLAAAIVASAPLAERVSTSLRNDETLVFLVMASVLAAGAVRRFDDARWALVAGCLAGAAAAVKYSGVFAVVPALLAVAAPLPARARAKALALACVGFATILALTNHYLWADLPNLVRQLSDQIAITGSGHWAATDNPAWVYTSTIAERGTGWPLLVLASAWTVFAVVAGRPDRWLLIAFPLAYLWFMAQVPSQLPRWIYPMVPFAAVAGSGTLWAVADWIAGHAGVAPFGARWLRPTAMVIVVAVVIAPIVAVVSVEFSRKLSESTFQTAIRWVTDRSSPTDTVLVEDAWLDLSEVDVRVRRVRRISEVLAGGGYQLLANTWIVVPEPDFYRVDTSRLQLVEQIEADFGFGGNQGFDFRIYSPPRPIARRVPFEIDLEMEASSPYRALDWRPGGGSTHIPEDGAVLFVPLAATDGFRVLLNMDDGAAARDVPPVALTVGGMPVRLSAATEEPFAGWWRTPLIAEGSVVAPVVELRLTPRHDARDIKLRMVAFR